MFIYSPMETHMKSKQQKDGHSPANMVLLNALETSSKPVPWNTSPRESSPSNNSSFAWKLLPKVTNNQTSKRAPKDVQTKILLPQSSTVPMGKRAWISSTLSQWQLSNYRRSILTSHGLWLMAFMKTRLRKKLGATCLLMFVSSILVQRARTVLSLAERRDLHVTSSKFTKSILLRTINATYENDKSRKKLNPKSNERIDPNSFVWSILESRF